MSLSVCDECRDTTKPTDQFRIHGVASSATVDLCADDAAGIEKLLKKHGKLAAPRGKFEDAKTTFEDIEIEKQRHRDALKR